MQEQELQELQSLSFDNCSNEVFMSPGSDHEPEIGQTLETGVMTPQVCITPVLSPTAGCGNQFFAGFPDSPKFQRKSPIKNMVRAYLPNHQTTSVSLFRHLLVRSDQVLLHTIVIPVWQSYCSKDRFYQNSATLLCRFTNKVNYGKSSRMWRMKPVLCLD